MTWRVISNGHETSAVVDPAAGDAHGPVFVCAHGAGGHMGDRSLLALSAALCPHGISVVRFNFFYRERRSPRPDPMPALLECFSAVVSRVRDELHPSRLIIGGRSMGGRAASMLAAEGFPCDGLLLLAYPLHPPGQPTKLRTAHLTSIRVPVLCVNGTRDPFSERNLMEAASASAGPLWTLHWLQGADHSFHVLKRSGTTDAAMLTEVAQTTEAWLASMDRGRP